MRVLLEGGNQEITLEGPLLGRGGEASIYAVPGRADLAAKIYHNPSDEHGGKLEAMLAAPPVAPPQPGQHVTVAWPVRRLLEPPPSSPPNLGGEEGGGRVIGYLMPRIDKVHLIWEIYNPGVLREICPHFHYGSLLRTARNLAAAVQTLHECGYVVGDLNESNVLVTSESLVTLIDVDSYQAPGSDRLYRCRVGRPEYTPPELQGVSFTDVDRLPEHDAFALAVLIFQLLMRGIHPFAGRSGAGEPDSIPARIAAGHWPYAWLRSSPLRPSPHAPPWFTLPPSVQELLRRCFEDAHAEPDLRPSAAQWQHALEEAEHELTRCPRDGQHVFPRRLDHCPWCTTQSTIPNPQSPNREPENRERKIECSKRKAVYDPLPPRPEETRPTPIAQETQAGGMELVFQAIGIVLEQSSWMIWLGVALMGAVVGVIYALQHALPGAAVVP
jgi:DNA-binding helix-hairpin-helix protein with protein kinase domain